MENHDSKENTESKKSFSIGGLLRKADAAGEMGFAQLFFHLPFVLFLVVLAALHIANSHLAESYVREIATKERQAQQMRWEYLSTTSGMMKQSKQSSVAVLVQNQGLKPLLVPPVIVEEK
jgi:hypothetical protein